MRKIFLILPFLVACKNPQGSSKVDFNYRPGSASSLFVNSTDQEVPMTNNGNCTLAEAITAANTRAAVDACIAGIEGVNKIYIPSGTYNLTAINATSDGLPVITTSIQLIGEDKATTIIRRSNDAKTDVRGATV